MSSVVSPRSRPRDMAASKLLADSYRWPADGVFSWELWQRIRALRRVLV